MIALILPLLLGLGSASAASQADADAITACLDRQDVACAEAVVERQGLARLADPVGLSLAAEVAFWAGDYPGAVDRLERAVRAGHPDQAGRLELFRRTMYATAGWVEAERGRFRVRYRPGADAILVDQAATALERTDRFVTPLLGGVPPGRTVVELYPDGRSFIAASSLTKDDVEATGVVAISKWSRLLVSSPRALSRGYEWQSTMSHEYIHLVVAHATGDRAPVWLQEGIARYLDNRWEGGKDAFALDARQQGYLARALARSELVPFEEMHPSLAKIKVFKSDGSIDRQASAERASLAYAQLSSLVDYCFETAGEGVLKTALPMVQQGVDPRAALASAVRAPTFDALVADWEAWIRRQPLLKEELAALPTLLDGGTEAEQDPVLSQRSDLANYLRLGDLLAERGHAKAALVEYGKAHDPDDPSSPLLANKVASALLALGNLDGAAAALSQAVRDYPTFALTWQTLGAIAKRRGDVAGAIRHLEKAAALSPFHLPTQETLLELYRGQGSAAAVARQEALVRVLRRGGEDQTPPPIHTRSGEYELPRDPSVAAKPSSAMGPRSSPALTDGPAPAFVLKTLDGATVSLASLKGKVVLLDFWATWCGPCRQVMPAVSAMAQRWAGQGLVVLGVSDESTAVVQRWVDGEARKGRTFHHRLATEDGSARRAYGVSSIPQLVVIDQGGVVRLVHVGSGDMDEVQRVVGRLLGLPESQTAP